MLTAELEAAFDRISKGFDGFYFGRYDIRIPSLEGFRHGRNFKIVELNGVTSEATHVDDPANSRFSAYRVLMRQWRKAFVTGRINRDRGVAPASLRRLTQMLIESWRWEGRRLGLTLDLSAIDVEHERVRPSKDSGSGSGPLAV